MARSPVRHRRVRTVVDAVESADLDMAHYAISEDTLRRIALNLRDHPFSAEDRVVGDIRIREVAGLDVIFIISREESALVITIGGLRPPDPKQPSERILKFLAKLAIFRGASGV